jgi:hypothetical protein
MTGPPFLAIVTVLSFDTGHFRHRAEKKFGSLEMIRDAGRTVPLGLKVTSVSGCPVGRDGILDGILRADC